MIDLQTIELTVDGEPLTYVDGTGGYLTMDRRWTPYIQGEVTVVEPDDISILDPRTVPRLVVEATQAFGPLLQFVRDLTTMFAGPSATAADVTDVWAGLDTSDISAMPGRWFAGPEEPTSMRVVAIIRDRQRLENGRVRVRFEGVEARYRDYFITGPKNMFASAYNTLRSVYDEVRGAGRVMLPPTGSSEFDLAPGQDFDVSIAASTTGFITTAGENVYDQMEPLLAVADARLWGDEHGRLRLTATTDVDPEDLALDGSRIVDADDGINMDDPAWADSLYVTYAEVNPSENSFSGFEYPPYVPGQTPTKVVKVELAGASPVYSWNYDTICAQIGAPLLERFQRRGRTLPVTAVADYTARPDRTAVVTNIPGIPDVRGIVTAVTFDFDSGEMTVVTENLEEIA